MFNFTIRYWQCGELKELWFNGSDYSKLEQFIFDHEDGLLVFHDGWYNDNGCDQNEFGYDHLDTLLNLMNYEEGRPD